MNSSSYPIGFDPKGNFTNWSDTETSNESNHFPFWDSPRNNYQKVKDWMNVYFLPTLILVGLVGNSLSVCVFILSHLRRLSSSVYLAALAVADAGFLFCALAEWCGYIGFQFHHKNGKFDTHRRNSNFKKFEMFGQCSNYNRNKKCVKTSNRSVNNNYELSTFSFTFCCRIVLMASA